ncbi:MAG: hypothetical protein Kow0029_08940 [Candidatus Rifleibacteriota bacterium]
MLLALLISALLYTIAVFSGGLIIYGNNIDTARTFTIYTNGSLSILMILTCFLNLYCLELLIMTVTLASGLMTFALILSVIITLINSPATKRMQTQN